MAATMRLAASPLPNALFNTAAGQTSRKAARGLVVRAVNTNTPVTAPDPTKVPPSTLDYAKSMPGVCQPFPDVFDPANLLQSATVPELKRWRESEITHGRVAMLASLGFIVQEQLEDFPAFYNLDGHITGPAINHFQQVEARGAIFWEPLIFAIALAEAYRVGLGWATPKGKGFNQLKDDYEPGELGFDPLGLFPSEPAAQKDMKTKELNNGRLAMIAIAAFVAQELVKKDEIFEHLFLRFSGSA